MSAGRYFRVTEARRTSSWGLIIGTSLSPIEKSKITILGRISQKNTYDSCICKNVAIEKKYL